MKNSKFLVLVLASVLVISFTSCGDDDQNDSYVNELEVSDYSLQTNKVPGTWRTDLAKDSVYIVNSDEELKDLLNTDATTISSGVDFSKNSILFVQIMHISGIEKITQSLWQTSPNYFLLRYVITPNSATVISIHDMALVTPKISENAKVEAIKSLAK